MSLFCHIDKINDTQNCDLFLSSSFCFSTIIIYKTKKLSLLLLLRVLLLNSFDSLKKKKENIRFCFPILFSIFNVFFLSLSLHVTHKKPHILILYSYLGLFCDTTQQQQLYIHVLVCFDFPSYFFCFSRVKLFGYHYAILLFCFFLFFSLCVYTSLLVRFCFLFLSSRLFTKTTQKKQTLISYHECPVELSSCVCITIN